MRQGALSPEDRKQLKRMGISESQIFNQLKMFGKGFYYTQLIRPATISNGITKFSKKESKHFVSSFENYRSQKRVMKFVPASGAASRMFEALISLCASLEEIPQKGTKIESKRINNRSKFFQTFIRGLAEQKFAFYNDLKACMSEKKINLDDSIKKKKYKIILKYLLTQQGLNYASLPKALLKFHQYGNTARTALEEHLIEAKEYARDRNGIIHIHFTLSEEYQPEVQDYLAKVLPQYESSNIRYKITFSIQKISTHTLAVDKNNKPLRNERGQLIFRPGGHGALIENLNEIEADLIFIKNIDNVVPDRLKEKTITYKKAIAGYLIVVQNRIFHYLEELTSAKISPKLAKEITSFCKKELHFLFPTGFQNWNLARKRGHLFERLNRPIRICGMVKNQGEPGGGPFWIKNRKNQISMQIIEKSQINIKSNKQLRIMNESSHFNPVDLVCGVKNFKGEKFDLHKYIDPDTYFISEKTHDGKPIKALELPGLWNGAMANWITLFAEIPIITFNPVKTVNDLLRNEHQ